MYTMYTIHIYYYKLNTNYYYDVYYYCYELYKYVLAKNVSYNLINHFRKNKL